MDTSLNAEVGKEAQGSQHQAQDLKGNTQATEAPTVDDGCDKETSTAKLSSTRTSDGERDLQRNHDTNHDPVSSEAMSGNEPLIIEDESGSDDDYPRFADTYKGRIVKPVVGPKPIRPKPRQDEEVARS